MEEIFLQAIEREKQHGKFRDKGFVPGALYGDNVSESILVKFDELGLKKVIASHGSNAKVWIMLNNNKKFGFIKEVQKHPVTAKLIHISVQIVSKDHKLKLQIPIVFKGQDDLKQRQLQLQVYKSEITVLGKLDLMLDAIYVDVSEMLLGDSISLNSFNLDKHLKVSEKEETVFGVINNIKIQPIDTVDEAETEQAAKPE